MSNIDIAIEEESRREFNKRNSISAFIAIPLLLLLLVCIFFKDSWGLYVGIPTLAIFVVFGFWSYHWLENTNKDVLKRHNRSVEKKHNWQVNKILWLPIIAIGISLPIIICALINHSKESLVGLGIWMLWLLFVLWKSMDNIWIYRRLPMMSPRHYKTVKVEINSINQTGDVYDVDSGISYRYDAKEKRFYMSRTMYSDPRRHPKEYEERKYQFETRIQLLRIPIEGWISPPVSTMSFGISVRLMKRYAKRENIRRIREVIIDLSKEDYNSRLFSKFTFGENTLYLDTYHYKIVRAVLVGADSFVEFYNPHTSSAKPSDRLAGIFEHICKDGSMDKLQPEDMITEEAFDGIWSKTNETGINERLS